MFEVFGSEQGLPSRQVHALVQDRDGRLWTGTAGGLVRYDGHGFSGYAVRPEDEHALASTSVEALVLDARGRLWVATEGGHLARWRPASDDFERFEVAAQAGVDGLELWSLAAAGERLWAGSWGAGLLELDLDGRLLARYQPPSGEPHVLDVLAEADEGLWVVTLDRHLWQFDARKRKFVSPELPQGAGPAEIYGLALRSGRPWLSTRDGRLCAPAQALRFECEPLPLLALPGRAHLLLASSGGDWIGGLGELLLRDGDALQRHVYEPGGRGSLPAQALWTALEDRDGGIWMGSAGGGLLQRPAIAAQFRAWQARPGGDGLRDGRVRGITRAADGRVWIGTLTAGLHRLDPASGEIDAFLLPGTDERRVWSLLAEGADELWIGHHQGLLRARIGADGSLSALRQWSGRELSGASIDLLHRDSEGRVWAASMGGGVDRIDPASGSVERHPLETNGLPGTEVQQLGQGVDGRVWAATDRGLGAYEEACRCWRPLLSGVRVDAWASLAERIYALEDGQLVRYQWRDGLFRDAEFAPRSFREVQTTGGLVAAGDALWLIGPQGLFRFRPDLDRIERFDSRDGLPGTEFSDRPPHVDVQGGIWIGGEDGLLHLDPHYQPAQAPPVQLRFERLGVRREGALLRLDAAQAGSIQAGDRELEVEVRLASLARPHAQRFSFRVRGWEDAHSSPSATPFRHLGTLPDGSYVLEVRAWDGHGRPAANALAWPFQVAPPWWRAPPALAGWSLLAALALWAGWRWRTRRQRVAGELAESRRQALWAQQLAGERTRLVAELSHEIRNPLNGVLGMTRLLQAQALSAEGRRHLGLLADAGQQLLRLLEDMLDWSRLDARSESITGAPVALAATLSGPLALLAQQADERGLRFEVDIAPGLTVMAERARLRQIVDNLVGNALKFTARGGISVQAVRDGERIRLSVQDTGPGMDAAQLARLFRPFERVGGERAAPGTGLGLAISRSLAERMGGSLRAESTLGTGSRFELELAAAPAPALALAPAPVARGSLRGLRVLIVEDDLAARESLLALLREREALAHAVADALSALLCVQQQGFDVALLDWDLPGMSGLELAGLLRTQHPQLVLIAVTGRVAPEDRARGAAAGFAAQVGKPVDPDRLCEEILRVR